MHIHFALPELAQLDELRCEALALPFFSDERPLRGALGLVDWRLCGMVSSLIIEGRIDGSYRESVLLPARPRLSMDKLFLFGLGPEEMFDSAVLMDIVEHMLYTVSRAGARTTAIVLPGRNTGCIEASEAMEAFTRSAAARPDPDEVIVLEAAEAQKVMATVVERERRRARASEV